MFCQHCGAQVSDNACTACGTKHMPSEPSSMLDDWSQEFRCDVLLAQPQVRSIIEQHASRAKNRMSSDEFLTLAGRVLPTGVPLAKMGTIAPSIATTLGIKTGKTRKASFHKPPGHLLVAILCSLARHHQHILEVIEEERSCFFKAILPSDMWSFEGELLIHVTRLGQEIFIEATTVIKGQMYDWGKSKRALKQLFEDVENTVF